MTDRQTKRARRLGAILLALLCTLATQAKQQDVFLFGVAASFNDSTIYVTPIQELRQAYVEDTRQKFLVGRNGYSDQLRNHFTQQGQPHRTCTTFWATTRKDIEKKWAKVMQKYGVATTDAKAARKAAKKKKKDRPHYRVVTLADSDFAYRVVTPDEGVTYVDASEAEAAARASKHKQGKAKDTKTAKPDGATPPPDGQTPPDGQRPPMDR